MGELGSICICATTSSGTQKMEVEYLIYSREFMGRLAHSQEIEDMTKTPCIRLSAREIGMLQRSFILGQMPSCQAIGIGRRGIGMSTRYDVMGFMTGGRSLGTISKVGWRIRFTGLRQFWGSG